jgi:lysophospholipase L1-like esterase
MTQPAVVICFGDSLTAGFQSPTRDHPMGEETPYGQFLQQDLGSLALVRISGICGELTSEMTVRFQRDVLDHQPGYVVILGGTNDLGWNRSPEEIVRNLIDMFERTLPTGAVPIPITVPSIRVEGETGGAGEEWIADHLARRRELNRLIEAYARSNNLPWVDLFTATSDPDGGKLASVYSNDGLHLTTLGYRVFAEQVARVLRPLITGICGESTSASGQRSRI